MKRLPKITQLYERCQACGGSGNVRKVKPASLRSRRQAAGVSLRAMAARIGVSPAYLSDVERGQRRVTERVVAAFEGLGR